MNINRDKIPNADDWSGYEADIEARYGHKLMVGHSLEELVYLFRDTSIERAAELLQMPRRAFQYYVFTFVQLFGSPAEAVGQSDCASVFLRLLCNRETQDPGSVAEIYPALSATVDYVASNQEFFDADVDIYGDFRDLAAEVKALCESSPARSAE